MLLIHCPHCGPRNEAEFTNGGPARSTRPADATYLSDAAWVDYLTVPNNPMGWVQEKWWHNRGCGTWFTIQRNTVTHQIQQARDHVG